MTGKYIIFGDSGFPEAVAFSETIVHKDIANGLGAKHIIGAGFFMMIDGRFHCYGESISLDVKSRGVLDSEILNRDLGGFKS